ncbi:hypothetical protein AB0C76_26260 [Kitasatospora sp. NPDC048722]|uniref:hypothetical protein n=1 Tax=Kitasatospora sp. NPDC048722 TaxID=3155639 RepID=UPI0033FA2007
MEPAVTAAAVQPTAVAWPRVMGGEATASWLSAHTWTGVPAFSSGPDRTVVARVAPSDAVRTAVTGTLPVLWFEGIAFEGIAASAVSCAVTECRVVDRTWPVCSWAR